MPASRKLTVAVLVELVRTGHSGGHVKCWEQLAAAAAERDDVDLTVYTLGRPGVEELAGNVRFVALRPWLSTGLLDGVVGGADATDLAPFHPGLARRLPRQAVWHLTHSAAFATTALRLRRQFGRSLVSSVQTDVPTLARLYTGQLVDRLPGPVRRAAGAARCDERAGALTRRRRDRILRASDRILASNVADAREFTVVAPDAEVTMLRRGLDTVRFSPARADRNRLARRHGIPRDRCAVLFAGRIDVTKGVPLLVEAMRRLPAHGVPAHLVLAGSGAAAEEVARQLGDRATVLGHLPQEELARVYAGCDVLAFPSRSETAGNVVAEAMAAGLPVVLPAGARTAQWLASPGSDGMLVTADEPEAWADALAGLLADPRRRRIMGRQARRTAERRVPSWSDVLEQDLLPVWRAAAAPAWSPAASRAPDPLPPAALSRPIRRGA